MINKYIFISAVLFITNVSAMNAPKVAPKLTALAAESIAKQLVSNINGQESVDWFTSANLPEEVRALVNYPFNKHHGTAYWKKSKKNFLVYTSESDQSSDHKKQLLALSKLHKNRHDASGYAYKESHEKKFKVVDQMGTGSYFFDCTEHKTEIRDFKNNVLHNLSSGWFSNNQINEIIITPNDRFVIINYTDSKSRVSELESELWKNGSIGIWDAVTGEYLHTLRRTAVNNRDYDLFISSMAVSKDSSVLVVGYSDSDYSSAQKPDINKGFIDIFDIKTGTLLYSFNSTMLGSQGAIIESVAISPNNDFIVVEYNNKKIKTIKIDLTNVDLNELIKHEISERSPAIKFSSNQLLAQVGTFLLGIGKCLGWAGHKKE